SPGCDLLRYGDGCSFSNTCGARSWTGGCGLEPLPMLFDQGDQTLVGFGSGDVVLDARLAHVEVDLAGRAADVTEVRIGHFPGAVHDAAHDGELDALEVARLGANAL